MYFTFATSSSVLGLRGFSMLWQGVEVLHCLILLHCVTTLYLDAFHCEENGSLPSSCAWGDRPRVELCVEPVGFSGRCMGVSVPLRVVPSSTGLPSKGCPGIGFLSRADRAIGVFRHVAPPTRLCLEFPRVPGILQARTLEWVAISFS